MTGLLGQEGLRAEDDLFATIVLVLTIRTDLLTQFVLLSYHSNEPSGLVAERCVILETADLNMAVLST